MRQALGCGLFYLALLAALPNTGRAQGNDKDEKPTIQFYPIQDLLTPRHGYRFKGSELPGIDPSWESHGGNRGWGFGGGQAVGGQGGQGGGGGGFFAVPDRVAAQFGGGAESGDGAGGFGGGGGGYMPPQTPDRGDIINPFGVDVDDLIEVITQVVEPDDWAQMGGGNSIHTLGGQLVVRATKNVHGEVAELLQQARLTTKSRVPLTVEAHWFRVPTTDASSFPSTNDALKSLLGTNGGPAISGRITGLNGQTVTLVTGTRESMVTSAIPVIGGTAAAYQPISVHPNLGALLEVKPILMSDAKSVMINVHSTVTKSSGKAVTRPHGDIQLDSAVIDAHQILTTTIANTDEYFVAGGLAMSKAQPGSEDIHTLFLVLRVSQQ
jgi:hypothetical protein